LQRTIPLFMYLPSSSSQVQPCITSQSCPLSPILFYLYCVPRSLPSFPTRRSSDLFESSSVPTTLPTAYDVYPLDGRHDGGYYTVKDCVTIDVLPRTPGNNVYVGFMVWSNFTATKCRGLVSLNQVIKEII